MAYSKSNNKCNPKYTNNANVAWAPRPENPINPVKRKPVYQNAGYGVDTQTNPTKPKRVSKDKETSPYMNFMDALKFNQNDTYNNISITENGAVGFKTTNSKILDFNYMITSMRNMDEKEIIKRFREAYNENPMLMMRFLFYVGDIKEGLGERRTFNICMKDLAKHGQQRMVNSLIQLFTTDMRRFDDIYNLIEIPGCKKAVGAFIKQQFYADLKNMKEGKPISLLAKWLKSPNTSSKESRHFAGMTREMLGINTREYQKKLAQMRKYIDVVERKMSSNNWQAIDYEAVPSKANLIYNNAFLKHDEERRRAYLEGLKKGEAKINAKVLMPHEIVHKYGAHSYSCRLKVYDETLEQLWKNLPDLVNGDSTTLVVADGSGSMTSTIKGTKVSALEVANALAIYFAERARGAFKNTYITFSNTPQLVHFQSEWSLRDKLVEALKHNEVARTNIEAVFDLLLNTAIKYNMKQEDIPANILVISDMEFNSACTSGYRRYSYARVDANLFKHIEKKWNDAGYKMSRLVFWNLLSRTGTIPMKENENGVILVSGFSVNTLKMVMNNETDPYIALVRTVMAPRYDIVQSLIEQSQTERKVEMNTQKNMTPRTSNTSKTPRKTSTVTKVRKVTKKN